MKNIIHPINAKALKLADALLKLRLIPLITMLFTLLISSLATAQVVEGVDYSDKANVDNTFDMAGTDILGQRFPSEYLTIKDEVTGVNIIALTTSRHNNSKIYQTHPQWTPDGKYIVFRSDRNANKGKGGHAYAVSMDNYEIVQVTTGEAGSDLHLGWKKNLAYQFRGNQLVEIKLGELLTDSEGARVKDASAYERVIATVAEDIKPSGMGLDANESRLFFSSKLEEDKYAIYSIDFGSGKTTKLIELPFRVGHLQANPYVSGEMMYCWETGGDAPQRIWYLTIDKQGKVSNRPLYKEGPEEWITHEVFMGPDHILFNVMGHLDRLNKNPSGIFSLNIRNNNVKKYNQAANGGYWHAAGTNDLKWAVGDTFNGNLYRLNLDNNKDVSLLTTGHRPNSKSPFTSEAHSHHSISPDGKWVLFNSSMLTGSDIMLVPLHPKGR